jgi:hypothetical protein
MIIANGGADIIHTGGGDDKVTINESNVTSLTGTSVIDGGTGVNALTLVNASAAATLDMTSATVAARLKNFSSIDLTGTQNNTLKLDWKAISTLSGALDNSATTTADESKMLVVSGNAGDTVSLVGLSSWAVGTSQTAASLTTTYGASYNFLSGHTYKAYTLNGATVFVDDAVTLGSLASSTTSYTPLTNAKSVQELFGPSFTDANAGQTFKGVAITSAGTSTNFTAGLKYQYSNDSGTTWIDLAGGLTDSTAVFLAPTTLIRFTDTSGASTAVASVPLTARLVDSSGLTGTSTLTSGTTNVDAHLNGGSTAFSANAVTVNLVNRAPTIADVDGVVAADPFGSAMTFVTASAVAPFSAFTGNGTFTAAGGTSITVTGNTGTITDSTHAPTTSYFGQNPLLIGEANTLETVNFAFSKPVYSVDIDFAAFNFYNAGSTYNYIQILINGQAYKLTSSNITKLNVGNGSYTGAALNPSTAEFTTSGQFLDSTAYPYSAGADYLNGAFRISLPTGINSLTIKDLDGGGSYYKVTVTEGVAQSVSTQTLTVDALFGQYFADADNNAFAGVLINGAGTSTQQTNLGKYQYSKDSGSTWTDLTSSTSDASAVYLTKTNLMRFVPSSANTSTVKFDLMARLVDASAANTFTAGNAYDVSTANGGTTAVSSTTLKITGSTAPVVLDLNHDGVLSYDAVQMDVLGTGHLQQTAWVGAQDGVLVWDKQADGQVHDNSQYAFAQYGAVGSTDLQGLAAGFDSNHDGVLDAKDAKFAQFAVWQDANQDGVVDAGEMHNLSQAGITAINLTSDGVVRTPNASVVEAGHSTAQLTDGTTMVVADAAFAAQDLAYHIDTSAPDAIKLLLTGAGMDLNLSSFAAKHGAIAEVDVSGTGANSIKLSLADVLQGTPHAMLTITGDADDSANVNLADWTNTGNTVAQGGHTYAVYNDAASHTAQLLIDQNLVNAGHVI